MSDPLFDYIDSKHEPTLFRTTPAIEASVEAYLKSLRQPNIYFENTGYGFYQVIVGEREHFTRFMTLPAHIGDDILYKVMQL